MNILPVPGHGKFFAQRCGRLQEFRLCVLKIRPHHLRRRFGAQRPSSCRLAPSISVMKSSQSRTSIDSGVGGRLLLDGSARVRVAESSVRTLAVVVPGVLQQESSEVFLVDWDDVVKQLATNGSNPAFRKPVMPRRVVGCRLRLDSKLLDPVGHPIREDRAIVMNQIAVSPGKVSPSCWITQHAVGWAVTLTRRTSRRYRS